jgi:competence protein ComEC
MVALVAAFLAGICLFQLQQTVPAAGWLGTAPLLVAAAWRYPALRLPAAVAVGFLWALAWVSCCSPLAYQPAWDERDLSAEGVVASLPERRGESLRFEFRVDRLFAGERHLPTPGRVRLSWRTAAQPVRLGEHWRLQVRLKPPRGFANPGGFDYEAWLFRAGIAATGYVVESPGNARLSAPAGIWRLAALRQLLHDRLVATGSEARATAVLSALAVGARGGFEADLWELFRRTGTTHLMSISGLHVSMVSGLVYGAVAWLWRRAGPLATRLPAQHAGAWAAVAAALGYSALAGFAVPTQRSLLMGAVALGAVLLRRAQRPALVLGIALLAVLLVDPVAVLAVDFWLSFGAVAVILFAALGRGPRTWRDRLRAWARVQLAITFALAPVTLLLFQQVSLVSPLANAWAIPWFGLVVVPAALLATVAVALAPAAGDVALVPAAWLAERGLRALDAMAALPFAELHASTPPWVVVLGALLGTLAMTLPRGVPGRAMGVVLYLPLLWQQPPSVPPEHVRLTLLDVGQGMAAVLRTHRHTLVYDLGPRLSAQFDATSAVVVPYLHHVGVRRIDAEQRRCRPRGRSDGPGPGLSRCRSLLGGACTHRRARDPTLPRGSGLGVGRRRNPLPQPEGPGPAGQRCVLRTAAPSRRGQPAAYRRHRGVGRAATGVGPRRRAAGHRRPGRPPWQQDVVRPELRFRGAAAARVTVDRLAQPLRLPETRGGNPMAGGGQRAARHPGSRRD